MPQTDLSLDEARRVALAAQGFDRPRPRGRVSASQLGRTIRRLGLLQVDFVNVLLPAHYLVPFSRLGPYDRSLFDDVVYQRGEFTEQWAHEASILPVASWPLLRHRMDPYTPRPSVASFVEQHPDYVDWVLDQVRARGPLSTDDLREPEGAQDAASGTDPGPALAWHFGRGVIAVAERRPNFGRVFDLAERILPPEHYRRNVGREEAQRELLRLAARSHGVAAAADLADYYRMSIREARPRLAELVEAGELREVRVEGWREQVYLHAEAPLPRRINASALLSPFDPVIWYRERAARLFDFDYRIEIYVPQATRKWGYYCLPFLQGDRLVARVDLKAERKERRLLVRAAFIEADAEPAAVSDALAAELRTLARWLELDGITVERRGTLASALGRALRD